MSNDQVKDPLEFLIAGYQKEPDRVAQAFLQFLKDKHGELESEHSWITFLQEIHRGTQVNIYAFKEAMKRSQETSH
jgi:bifunctional pyridoxal-dependent enzyme with beta-cystathionase and maltose regulon repressor activities